MALLTWDTAGTRKYETGLSKGVLYPQSTPGTYSAGVAWNGLTAITDSPGGAELSDLYADDMKYASLRSAETCGGTIEAYTYPDEFGQCDGSAEPVTGMKIGQQSRKAFGLCYKTMVGDDTVTDPTAYKLHIVYNATASPSEKAYQTINDNPEALTFSWEFSTTPVLITGYKPVSTIVIDSTAANATCLAALETKLYGTASTEPELPTPDEIVTLLTPAQAPVQTPDPETP